MKHFGILTLVTVILFGSLSSSLYAITETSSFNEKEYWEQKKISSQEASTKMRLEYYEKYKAKGYDVGLIAPELLDGKLTEESRFWEALKKVQNAKEIPERRAYLEKLKKYGLDTSIFTEDIIQDSGKFWELYKNHEKLLQERKTEEENRLKQEKKLQEEKQKEQKKSLEVKPISENKGEKRAVITDRVVELFRARLEKIPEDTLIAYLPQLKKNIATQLEKARSKGAKLTISRLEKMLQIVETKQAEYEDLSLLDELFK
jgi:hypothetical protein